MVVYITRTKIWYLDRSTKPVKKMSIDWDGQNAEAALAELKKKTGVNKVRIIAGDSLDYVLHLTVPVDESSLPAVKQKAGEIIPEDVSGSNFIFKTTLQKTTGVNDVQVFGLPLAVHKAITEGATKNGIKIEYFVSVSSLLANHFKSKVNPHLVVWSGEEKLAAVANKGMVYVAKRVTQESSKKIVALINYAKNEFGLIVKDAYTSWSEGEAPMPVTLKGQKINIDLFSFTDKLPSRLDNDGVLFLKPYSVVTENSKDKKVGGNLSKQKPDSNLQSEATEEPVKSNIKSVVALMVLIILLVLLVIWLKPF